MVRRKVMYVSVILLGAFFIPMSGSESKDNITEVFSCKGENVQCDSNLVSAFGSFSYDTDNLNVNHLGQLIEDSIETIKFPQENEKVLYSFTLAPGEEFEAGQTLTLLIVSFNLKNPLPLIFLLFFLTMNLKFLTKKRSMGKNGLTGHNLCIKYIADLRKLPHGTEIATIFSQRAITSQMVKLKTDGTIVIANKVEDQEAALKAEEQVAVMKIFAAQP